MDSVDPGRYRRDELLTSAGVCESSHHSDDQIEVEYSVMLAEGEGIIIRQRTEVCKIAWGTILCYNKGHKASNERK